MAVQELLKISEAYKIRPFHWPTYIFVGLFFLFLAVHVGHETPLLSTSVFAGSAVFVAAIAPLAPSKTVAPAVGGSIQLNAASIIQTTTGILNAAGANDFGIAFSFTCQPLRRRSAIFRLLRRFPPVSFA